MELNSLSRQIYAANVEKGFYEDNANLISHLFNTGASEEIIETAKKAIVGQRLSLIVSEVSEALEGNRKDLHVDKATNYIFDEAFKSTMKEIQGETFEINFKSTVKDTFEDEIADAVIRLLDLCGAYGIDIDFHVSQKLKYNALRPHKHGKKY